MYSRGLILEFSPLLNTSWISLDLLVGTVVMTDNVLPRLNSRVLSPPKHILDYTASIGRYCKS